MIEGGCWHLDIYLKLNSTEATVRHVFPLCKESRKKKSILSKQQLLVVCLAYLPTPIINGIHCLHHYKPHGQMKEYPNVKYFPAASSCSNDQLKGIKQVSLNYFCQYFYCWSWSCKYWQEDALSWTSIWFFISQAAGACWRRSRGVHRSQNHPSTHRDLHSSTLLSSW